MTSDKRLADLRALAAQKGFTIERAPVGDRWHLIGPSGNAAFGPHGTPSYRTAEAMKFLKKQADAADPPSA